MCRCVQLCIGVIVIVVVVVVVKRKKVSGGESLCGCGSKGRGKFLGCPSLLQERRSQVSRSRPANTTTCEPHITQHYIYVDNPTDL